MPPPPVDPAQVSALCRLARLQLPPERAAELAGRLEKVLAAFASLAQVDTRGVEPAAPASASLRPDQPTASLTVEQALANAQRTAAGCFLVPRVVDG